MSIVDSIQKINSISVTTNKLPWQQQIDRKIENLLESLGTIIEVCDKVFFICSYHSICYSERNSIIFDSDDIYELPSKFYKIPEIDIAIIIARI